MAGSSVEVHPATGLSRFLRVLNLPQALGLHLLIVYFSFPTSHLFQLVLQIISSQLRTFDWPAGHCHIKSVCEAFMDYDKINGGRAWYFWPQLLTLAFPHLEQCNNGVEVLVTVAERALSNFVNCCEDEMLQFVEFCAGKAQLSREMIRQGFKGASVDILSHQNHDMMSAKGIRTWVDMICSSSRKSLHWFGTRCSSFVVLCLSGSLRYRCNRFCGDTSKPWVEVGNYQQEVTALCMFLCILLGSWPVLEQPGSSCMMKLPSLSHVFNFFNFKKTVTYMGSFGGPFQKPLQIWHPEGTFEGLRREKPDPLLDLCAEVGESWNGDKTFTGNKELLELSEHYTAQFGSAVALIFDQIRSEA